MDYRPLTRSAADFQQPISAADIRAVTRVAFGGSADVVSAVELGGGFYNSTFKVNIGQERPVILRVAPEPARQARADPELMRNEYASVPYLASIADLLPRNLAVDFTHQVIGRDYLFQTMLDGVPAATALKSYPEQVRGDFYRELGEVTRAIHGVRGRQFGPVAGPTYERWSDALFAWFGRAAADLTDHGLDASAVTELMRVADRNRQVLDEVQEPRLLHGDLWVGNTMLAANSPVPSISGVFDCDRTWWGDPEADWPIYLALRKPGSERDAFWSSYGKVHQAEEARWRAKVYEAKHAAALMLEYHRFGRDEEVTKTNNEIRDLTASLRG